MDDGCGDIEEVPVKGEGEAAGPGAVFLVCLMKWAILRGVGRVGRRSVWMVLWYLER